MFYYLFHDVWWQSGGPGFLRVFGYTSTRIIAAAITALLVSFLLGPWFIRKLQTLQVGQPIRDDGPETHKVKQGTPTMGGVLILFSLLIGVLCWCNLKSPLVLIASGICLGFGAIGFVDDYLKVAKKNSKGVPGKVRLFLEFAICFAAFTPLFMLDVWGPELAEWIQVPFARFDERGIFLEPWMQVLFASVVVVGCANAVNLTDGLDGLAIGPTIINSGTFLVLAYIAGSQAMIVLEVAGEFQKQTLPEYLGVAYIPDAAELAIFSAAVFGAGIGFLWYNTYPASVFMGDVGSLGLGGAIGAVAVLTKNELVLLIVGGLFVVEALSVMIQVGVFKSSKRFLGREEGKRVFLMAPIHHHYEKKGWAEPKIIVRFWIISILLALLALGTLKLR